MLSALIGLSALAPGALAETTVVSPAPASIAVTIYRDDLALITETRRLDLPAGRSTISFEGVNDRIIPQSAILEEFGAVEIERNFDFDLISPASFFESALGEEVILTRTNRATGRVTRRAARVISSAPGQGVVLETEDGFEAYQCSGLPESLSAASLPATLKARPTLSLVVNAEEAGEQELTVSYLASGFGWNADYVLDEPESAPVLFGWLTLTNSTSSTIENAETAIVAGNLQTMGDTYSEPVTAPRFFARCWPRGSTKRGISRYEEYAPPPGGALARRDRAYAAPAAEAAMDESIMVTGARMAEREDLGDYKLYRTPFPTTVAAHQTKQIAFLDKGGLDVSKRYVFAFPSPDYFDETPAPAQIRYEIDNAREGVLAEPLPEGVIRAYESDADGRRYFLGEDDLPDIAVGRDLEADVASASDVRIASKILRKQSRAAGDATRHEVRVEQVVSNARPAAVEVEITLGEDFYAAIDVTGANRRMVRGESVPTWRFSVPANSSETLTYAARWAE